MPHPSESALSPPFVFVSGRLALGADGRPDGADIGQQTALCLGALESALRSHGLDRSHIVKTTVWITRREDFAAFDERYAGFFGDHRPARSTVIAELVVPGCLVEIEAIAKAAS
jgi:2-iminobutanoate/2-iminopropanoate deaminase